MNHDIRQLQDTGETGKIQDTGKVEVTFQRMPIRTWSRSHVNDAKLVLQGPDKISFPDGTDRKADFPAKGHPASEQTIPEQTKQVQNFDGLVLGEDAAGLFVSAQMGAFLDERANRRYYLRIPDGQAEKEPILLSLHPDTEDPILVDDVIIEAKEGSRATVILNYTSEAGAPVRHYGRTRVIAHRNAEVKLIKIQMLNRNADHVDAVGGVVHEGAQLDVILAELGAARQTSSCNIILEGEGGGAKLDAVYLGDGERSLDMSYRVEHRGRKTVSHICAKGVLMERSKKVFRDTLDFISGSSGSKGREEESVLMLSPEVRNISVPLMPCGEDDVEGEHAVSSGRPDERILFYLASRGIDEVEAKKLLTEAAVSSIVEKIPDASIRDAILAVMRKSIEKGEETA